MFWRWLFFSSWCLLRLTKLQYLHAASLRQKYWHSGTMQFFLGLKVYSNPLVPPLVPVALSPGPCYIIPWSLLQFPGHKCNCLVTNAISCFPLQSLGPCLLDAHMELELPCSPSLVMHWLNLWNCAKKLHRIEDNHVRKGEQWTTKSEWTSQDCLTLFVVMMQLFTRRAARSLYKNQRIKRWCFDVELIYLAQELHIPVREVDVEWREVPGKFMW